MLNAFIGKSEQPGDSELSAALGPSKVLWDRLLAELAKEQLITGWGWHSYSVKAGWSLRVQRNKRNILYMVPRSDGWPDAGGLPRAADCRTRADCPAAGGLPDAVTDAGGLPRARGFLAAFVFGDKALAAIRAGKFPPAVMELIASARKYAEGTGVRLEVKGPKDVDVVKKLAAIKVAN